MDTPLRLSDGAYLVFRKQRRNEMVVHQFRTSYCNLFNEKDAPSRAKLLKLPIIKSQFSEKYKKTSLKLIIEKEDVCDCDRKSCYKIHNFKKVYISTLWLNLCFQIFLFKSKYINFGLYIFRMIYAHHLGIMKNAM